MLQSLLQHLIRSLAHLPIPEKLLQPMWHCADSRGELEILGYDELSSTAAQYLIHDLLRDSRRVQHTALQLSQFCLVVGNEWSGNPRWMHDRAEHTWCLVNMLDLLSKTCEN